MRSTSWYTNGYTKFPKIYAYYAFLPIDVPWDLKGYVEILTYGTLFEDNFFLDKTLKT